MPEKIKSIFIIGINRSGTKWLSNIFCNNPDIIGIQSDRRNFGGILETNIFNAMQHIFGDLGIIDNYIGFIELWSQTDFFKISGADKNIFYKLKPQPTNYYRLFEILMNDYAYRNNKAIWLQKTQAFNVFEIMKYFKKSYFLVIKRNVIDTVKSLIKLANSNKKKSSLLETVIYYTMQEKIIKKIRRNDNIFYINYEELRQNPEKILKIACQKIGINYSSKMLNVTFQKNTSFRSGLERETFFSKKDILKIIIINHLFRLLPLFVLKAIRSVAYIIFKKKKDLKNFMPDTFGLIKDRFEIFK